MSSVNGLIKAAQNGNVKELSAILSTNPELVNAQDTVSDNHVVLVFFLLVYLFLYSFLCLILFLVFHFLFFQYGMTSTMWSACNDHVAVLEILIKNNADLNIQSKVSGVVVIRVM